MDKKTARYIIDVGMLISGAICAITGVIKFPALLHFFDVRSIILPVYQITLAHDWSGVFFVVLIIAHLAFNWRWMKGVTMSLFRTRPKPAVPGRKREEE